MSLIPNNSLVTATPEEGRELAIKMARLVIKATQPDEAVRGRLRDVYANDAAMLISIGHVVATEFASIAAAKAQGVPMGTFRSRLFRARRTVVRDAEIRRLA